MSIGFIVNNTAAGNVSGVPTKEMLIHNSDVQRMVLNFRKFFGCRSGGVLKRCQIQDYALWVWWMCYWEFLGGEEKIKSECRARSEAGGLNAKPSNGHE